MVSVIIKNRNILLAYLIIVFIFYFPNLLAFLLENENYLYTGQNFWFDPWDINVYLATIKWSQYFDLFLQNSYTSIPHEPRMFYPFYSMLGYAFDSISHILLYYLSIIITSALLFATIFKAASSFIKEKNQTLLATLLVITGGGFGWIFHVYSADFSVTPFTFLNSFQRPHEMFALSFYIISLLYFFKLIKNTSKKYLVYTLLFFLPVVLFYPYHTLSYIVTCSLFGLYMAVRKANLTYLKLTLIPVVSAALAGLFWSIHLSTGNGFEGVIFAKYLPPHPIQLILGYGILFPFLIWSLFKKKNDTEVFLLIWFFSGLLLAYITIFGSSKSFLRGLFLPATLLLMYNLKHISEILGLSRKKLLLILSLLPLTTVLIFTLRIMLLKNHGSPWVFITHQEKEVIDFLKNDNAEGKGVIAEYPLSNLIPAHTLSRVYFGHYSQSPNSIEKQQEQKEFFVSEIPKDNAKLFLTDNNIHYVIFENTAYDQSLFENQYDFLNAVFENDSFTIYHYDDLSTKFLQSTLPPSLIFPSFHIPLTWPKAQKFVSQRSKVLAEC